MRTDFSNISALLRLPAQQDVARLALAERAAERGIIGASELGAVYRATSFPPDVLAAPLASSESGLRFRALLFRALEEPKEAETKIAFVVKFVQSTTPAFLNGAGTIVATMLGDVKPASAQAKDALTVAQIYMLAGKNEAAQVWFDFAQKERRWSEDMQILWPQFALAGFETESAYAADFEKWYEGALKASDEQTVRNVIAPTLLLLDAAGLKVPETAWTKVFFEPLNEKKFAFSPLLFERMRAAAAEQRRAETVLLAMTLAGESDISLPVALGITAALNQIGYKNEALLFARQAVALLTKDN